ncbi:MAG: hypothetical protein ACSHW0_16520 [Thalassotalea sp.]
MQPELKKLLVKLLVMLLLVGTLTAVMTSASLAPNSQFFKLGLAFYLCLVGFITISRPNIQCINKPLFNFFLLGQIYRKNYDRQF